MTRALMAAGAALTLTAGCLPQQAEEVSGRALYAENCAVCHGTGGRGDGPAAEGFTPPPSDLTLLSRNNGGVFPLVAVMSYIDGYTRDERSAGMPAFGALLEGRTLMIETGDGILTPTPEPLVALAEYLRTLQR
ncbi:MAG: c-type cytochrome [Alkalilacustris sp.]